MKYADLHLCVPWADLGQAKRPIVKSAELGYSQVGVPLPPKIREETVGKLREICEENGLDFVARLDLAARSPGELLTDLSRFRKKFEVIAVLCSSKAVARQAAKDRRVDLLDFQVSDSRKQFFDRAEAELASGSGAAFEVDLAKVLSHLAVNSGVGVFSRLRREVAVAKSFGVPVVFSSGTSDPKLLRKPHDYAALASLFNTDESHALQALSVHPAKIVERNREKQSSEYTLGVRVVREAGSR
jgi:ribonuclease P/MRP protein subunit RPP1